MSRYHVTLPFLFAAIFIVASSGMATGIEINADPCSEAATIDLNDSLRGYGPSGEEPLFVKLEVPSAGILSLDVSVPGTARVLPKLGFADFACGASEAKADVVLERSATHLVLAAERSGPRVFQVASQDPTVPLHEFKLRSGFSPDVTAPFVEKEGEDEEIIELEEDPLIFDEPTDVRSLPSRYHELCRGGETDDHGDTFTCATLLIPGRDTPGEIRNGWGDDGDVFRLVLGGAGAAGLWTLELETTGSIDTVGGLYDQFGTRLETGLGGADSGNFRIVRVLPAAVYYVRIGGLHGDEGFYGLRVESSPW